MLWVDQAHTLLSAFYGSDELGNGLADVIFGKVNLSRKLALTFSFVPVSHLKFEHRVDPLTGNN